MKSIATICRPLGRMALITIIAALGCCSVATAIEADPPAFDSTIAPLLATHCLECHGPANQQGGLDLSQRQRVLEGGESGAVISPGNAEESLLLQMVLSGDMPRDRPPLTDAEQESLRQWIDGGAPWGADRIDPLAYSSDRRAGYDWWSLQPLSHTPPPPVTESEWIQNEIDQFILARLESHDLHPAPRADRRTLIRRLYFDLIGLPPEPEAVEAFLDDRSPRAYENLVDRLLASPEYGQRWARHWLDVVRFGETQGYERNRIRENAWRYRDWVINSLNEDLPYDEFIRLQIAGDRINPGDYGSLIATGYLVCGTWDQVGHVEGSALMRSAARWDHLEDLVATVSQSLLGLTVNCSRCHDHKFDPVSQQEYYQFAALLGGVHQEEKEREGLSVSGDPGRFAGAAHVIISREPPVFHLLARGDFRDPREVVSPRGLEALSRGGLAADFGLGADAPEALRRQKLAHWIADPENPLTARVFVNRLWHHHFGRGIVDTPSDFGFSGGRPSHPDLLDWLAGQFIDGGWRIKDMHRLIVTSATYRQASNVRDDRAARIDGDNRLLWRFSMRRLEGESIRDAALAVSGALQHDMGGPSFRDMEVKITNNAEFTDPTNAFNEDVNRRTIYRLWARSGSHPLLEAFDCPDPSVMAPVRMETVTPVQSLSMFNSTIMEKCGERLAARLQAEAGDDVVAQIGLAYLLLFGRPVTEQEDLLGQQFIARHGLAQYCLVLINTNEFVHVN